MSKADLCAGIDLLRVAINLEKNNKNPFECLCALRLRTLLLKTPRKQAFG